MCVSVRVEEERRGRVKNEMKMGVPYGEMEGGASVEFGRTLIYEVQTVCNERRKRFEGSGTAKSWQNHQNRLSKSNRSYI